MFFEGKFAAFEAMRPDIDALPPAERRRFAELCRRWADLAEPHLQSREFSPAQPVPVTGVLLELNRGHRSEE
jgi:hypothetical protein